MPITVPEANATFKDRVVLTEQPDLVIEGMTIAALTVGAAEGVIYLRGEYRYLRPHLEGVLERRRTEGLLGSAICGREGFDFDIRIQLGAGAYVCGEESALIESMEGKRGAPRDRPPFPVTDGFLHCPTVVNNVTTLCSAARIVERGGEWFAAIGTRDSTGTKLLSISGDVDRPGVYELPFGTSVYHLLERAGGLQAAAVQVGGASGKLINPKDYGREIAYEDLSTGGAVMVFGQERDLLEVVRGFTEFFVDESCGWCAPCRVGTTLVLQRLDALLSGGGANGDLGRLQRLCEDVQNMSRCGLGQTAANPILSSIAGFPELYQRLLQQNAGGRGFDLERALASYREVVASDGVGGEG